jgi:hypothetical protein
MRIFQPTISGSALTSGSQIISGSLFVSGAVESRGSGHTVTYNTSSGLFTFTASSAIGGGGSGAGFPYVGNAVITGSLVVSGSSGGFSGITGSLLGTASYVTGSIFTDTNPALSSSYAVTASYAQTYPYNSTSSLLGDDVNNIYYVNHGFNTRNLHITVYENFDDYETVYPDVKRPHPDTASITFANPVLSTKQYMVYISI